MSVTPSAKPIAKGIRSEGVRTYASAAHNNTVTADAQLPGPGRNRPIPKNVATSVAHVGVRCEWEGGIVTRSL